MTPYTPEGDTREKVYRFVRRRLELGEPPTVREVQAELGFRAVETARQHLERLVEAGRLAKRRSARGGSRARGYCLPRDEAVVTAIVPLLGRVPAGGLQEAVENPEGTIAFELPDRRSTAKGLFALRVEGESMTGAGILPGDVVIVRRQPTAQSGEIVVAMVGDEATVKTLRLVAKKGRGRGIELHPENPRFKPIVPGRGEEVQILGRVVEVRRYLSGNRVSSQKGR